MTFATLFLHNVTFNGSAEIDFFNIMASDLGMGNERVWRPKEKSCVLIKDKKNSDRILSTNELCVIRTGTCINKL